MISMRHFAFAALAFPAMAATAGAAPVGLGDLVVASGGAVTAYFQGHTAGYTSHLYLERPGDDLIIFNNQSSAVGDSVALGSFAAGTELKFYIVVQNTGDVFFTGPGTRNADGQAHAHVVPEWRPGETFVGFEDLFGGGDQDYDDLKFSFTNTTSAPSEVPVPAAGLLLAGGLGGLAVVRRRRG